MDLSKPVNMFVVILMFFVIGIFANTAEGEDRRSLHTLKHVARARKHTRGARNAYEMKRLMKREAVKHNHYRYLKNRHLALIRLKRGWLTDDTGNRATETATTVITTNTPSEFETTTASTTSTPTTTSTTTTTTSTTTATATSTPTTTTATTYSTTPTPPLPTTESDETTTEDLVTTATSSTSITVVTNATEVSVTYNVTVTGSPIASTTETSVATCAPPYLYIQIFLAMITVVIFKTIK